MTLSVVIPVHNGGANLVRCLETLARSTLAPAEIVVVDDASTDDSAEHARRGGARVVALAGTPHGPAAARNAGVAHSTGDVILFLDADVAVHPDTIARLTKHLESSPAAAIFGSYDDQPPDRHWVSLYKNLLHHHVHQHAAREASTFWAGCGAIRRQAFQAVGGFDERYARPCIEDIELGGRLRRAGYSIEVHADVQVTHLKHWTLAGLLRSDILDRAVPWTRLLLQAPQWPTDLNLDSTNRISAVCVAAFLMLFALGFVAAPAWLGIPLAVLALVILNHALYGLFVRRGGLGFAVCAVGLHWLYLTYGSAVFAGLWIAGHVRSSYQRPEVPATESADGAFAKGGRPAPAHDAALLVLFFGLLVAVKLWWVHGAPGPIVFGDEYLYLARARSLLLGQGLSVEGRLALSQPPLYSVMLLPALVFGSHWYFAVLGLNALVSSTIVFPVWWMARRLLSRRQAWACVLLASLIPYHVVFPRLVLSENLFLPLFLASVCALLADTTRAGPLRSLGIGLLWGLTNLTRSIFAGVVPILALLWWFKPEISDDKNPVGSSRQRAHRIGLALAGWAITWIPWFLFTWSTPKTQPIAQTQAVGDTLALGGTRIGSSPSMLAGILMWLFLFVCYLALMTAPYLPTVACLPWIAWRKIDRRSLFFFLSTLSLAGALEVIASVYLGTWGPPSFRSGYIEGRYLMYILPMLPVLSLVILNCRQATAPWAPLAGLAIAAISISTGYMVLYSRLWWPTSSWFAGLPWVSGDALPFGLDHVTPLEISYVALCLVTLTVTTAVIAVRPRLGTAAFVTGALILYGVGTWTVADRMNSSQEQARHARNLVELLQSDGLQLDPGESVPVRLDSSTGLDSRDIQYALRFWGLPQDRVVIQSVGTGQSTAGGTDPATLVLTRGTYPNPLRAYRVNDDDYAIYRDSDLNKEPVPLRIDDFGPTTARQGQPFNVQPDGMSAFWFKTQNATSGTVVIFDGTPLATVVGSAILVTAAIPNALLGEPRTVGIYLRDPVSGRKSNVVEFRLDPP